MTPESGRRLYTFGLMDPSWKLVPVHRENYVSTTIGGRYALALPGWEDYSVWGMDRMEKTYGLYANLWRNTDDVADNPRHAIWGVQDLPSLAVRIARATGCEADAAANAISKSLGWNEA